jgi:glyceraldehyde-3-phosphate dehydrogenase (NAD(P))
MVRIFINGFGNIGRRLATYLDRDKEIQLVGVAKYNADERAKEALSKGYDLYVPENLKNKFKEKKI